MIEPQQRLIQSAVLRWMNDLSPQGILLTDTAFTIIGWNRWLEEHTGLRASKVQGNNLFDLLPELVDRGLDAPYRRAIEGQVTILSHRLHQYLFRIPISSPLVDFAFMQQSARISPLLHNGEIIGAITVIDDVTERVAREIELQKQLEVRSRLLESEANARKEAEEANRLKDEFLATISHELRTPLTSIVGWARLLQMGKLDPDTATRGIDIIYRNAHSQAQLISDLLDVSRIISNKLVLKIGNVNLPSIIEAVIDALVLEASEAGVVIDGNLPDDFPLIPGDPERLQQVIWNLLSNAIKFTPEGGHVKIRLERAETDAVVTVTDSGIGIDPQFQPHVFDRFRQASSDTTRTHGGLGLGLSIVRQLTELHGGRVDVHSEGANKGSTFVIRLPLTHNAGAESPSSKTADEELPPPESVRAVLTGLRILVVDDEPDTRDFLRTAVERYGSRVQTATSASEALKAIETYPPDFLISDIGMPGEDGNSLIRKVRALPDERGGRTPAIALTAYVRSEDQREVIQSGFQMHLSKPVEPHELAVAIATIVTQQNGGPKSG